MLQIGVFSWAKTFIVGPISEVIYDVAQHKPTYALSKVVILVKSKQNGEASMHLCHYVNQRDNLKRKS